MYLCSAFNKKKMNKVIYLYGYKAGLFKKNLNSFNTPKQSGVVKSWAERNSVLKKKNETRYEVQSGALMSHDPRIVIYLHKGWLTKLQLLVKKLGNLKLSAIYLPRLVL